MIVIYSGIGVGQFSLYHVQRMCAALFPNVTQILATAHHIQKGCLKNARLFIMPGGADMQYMQALSGSGNAHIKDFVYSGGTYLGICAGSYYAARDIRWAVGTADEIIEKRELEFYGGTVVGPMYSPYDSHSLKGVRVVKIDVHWQIIPLYYNGGGYFMEPKSKNEKIIGIYTPEKYSALVDRAIGIGRSVLSGVHLEVDPYMLDVKKQAFSAIAPVLKKHNDERLQFLHGLKLLD